MNRLHSLRVAAVLGISALGCAGQVSIESLAGSSGSSDGGGSSAGGGSTASGGSSGASKVDLSCDGSFGCSGATLWSKSFLGADGAAIAADRAGNVLVTGAFMDTVDFGDGPMTSAGAFDAFVAKLDPQGQLVWVRQFGGAKSDAGSGIAVDADDNILVTGHFWGKGLDFGGGPLEIKGQSDGFVLKLDPAGNHLWSRRFGGSNTDVTSAIAVDGKGRSVVLGEFIDGPTDLGEGKVPWAGHLDVFVLRFDAEGTQLHARSFGGAGWDHAVSVTVSAAGDAYVTGSFEEKLAIGTTTLASIGSGDIYLAKLDSAGSWSWAKRFGGGSADVGYDVRMSPSGNIVMTGLYSGGIDFGGPPLAPAPSYQPFLAELSPSGAHVGSKGFGGSEVQAYGHALGVDAAGSTVFTGNFGGSLELGGGPLIGAGSEDVFVAKRDSAEQPIWSRSFGDEAQQVATAMAVDVGGNTLLLGRHFGTIDFGAGLHISPEGKPSMFLVKLAP